MAHNGDNLHAFKKAATLAKTVNLFKTKGSTVADTVADTQGKISYAWLKNKREMNEKIRGPQDYDDRSTSAWVAALKGTNDDLQWNDERNNMGAQEPLDPVSNSHVFQESTYKILTPCDVCQKPLRGHARQGIKCKLCKINCHHNCRAKVRMCVRGTKQVRRQLSSADLQQRVDYADKDPYMAGPANGDAPRSRMLSKQNSRGLIDPRQECSPAGRLDRRDRPPLSRNRSQSANPMQTQSHQQSHHPYYGNENYPPPDVWSAEPYHTRPYNYEDHNMRPKHQAPAPPERPRRRYVENPEIPADPNFDAKNSWRRRFAGKPELPTEPNFDAQNKQNEKYNGNSKMTADPNFNAKNSWKSFVSNPKPLAPESMLDNQQINSSLLSEPLGMPIIILFVLFVVICILYSRE